MNAGDLRHNITILKKNTTRNNKYGDEVTEYINIVTVWASVRHISYKEMSKNLNEISENTVYFTVRYRKILEKMDCNNYVIRFNDDIYSIKNIDFYDYSKTYIKFACVGG